MPNEIYSNPKWYDLGFSWDPSKELDFLEACFKRYGFSSTRRVLELGCGTGRLLIGLARRGYEAVGIDNIRQMVEFTLARARQLGLDIRILEADMENFKLDRRVEAAFCAIDTFRYLLTEEAALSHLRCVGRSMIPGGVYVIDLTFVGLIESYPQNSSEEWSIEGENASVKVAHTVVGVPDLSRRLAVERLTLAVTEKRATREFRNEEPMRTYTKDQFETLTGSSGLFEIVAWHGPDFDIQKRVEPGSQTKRVIAVLRRRETNLLASEAWTG
jgi:SAM-dependent methyltransferase